MTRPLSHPAGHHGRWRSGGPGQFAGDRRYKMPDWVTDHHEGDNSTSGYQVWSHVLSFIKLLATKASLDGLEMFWYFEGPENVIPDWIITKSIISFGEIVRDWKKSDIDHTCVATGEPLH